MTSKIEMSDRVPIVGLITSWTESTLDSETLILNVHFAPLMINKKTGLLRDNRGRLSNKPLK